MFAPRRPRSILAPLLVAAALSLFAVLPAAASAKDYCVAPNDGCGATNVDTLEKALDQADDDPDADRILLGAFKYVAPTAGYEYSKSGYPVEIVGKGAGQTTLTGPSGASSVLRLLGGAGNSVRDLSIEIPPNVAAGFSGLSTDGIARRLDVTQDGPQQAYVRKGVYLENGGTLEDSTVKLDGPTPYTRGVWIDAGGGSVRRSTVFAYVAISSRYGGQIERCQIGTAGGGLAAGGGTTTIANTVINLFQGAAAGIAASAVPGYSPTVNADGLTIVGADRATTQAVWASTSGVPDQSAYINIRNSIIQGGRLETNASGAGHAEIAVSYSDFDPTANEEQGTNAHINASNTTNVGDPGFADPALIDYHLLPSSPLIDAGDPNTAAGTDLDGKPNVIDGNGDGIARRDMGAFEYGVPAPGAPPPAGNPTGNPGGGTPVDAKAPVVSAFRASRIRFRYTLSEAARVTVRIQRRRTGGRYVRVGTLRRTGAKGLNRIRFGGRIGKRALRPGRYRAVIVATDKAGNRSTPRRSRFRIALKWAV